MPNPDDKAYLEWLKLQKAGTKTVRTYLDKRIADLTKKLEGDKMVAGGKVPPEIGSGD